MAIILKANKVNLFVSSVLFVFWYHSPNFLDTPSTIFKKISLCSSLNMEDQILLTNQPTPSSIVLLEKLIGSQLAKKFPALYGSLLHPQN
jgi:hypothetical protein